MRLSVWPWLLLMVDGHGKRNADRELLAAEREGEARYIPRHVLIVLGAHVASTQKSEFEHGTLWRARLDPPAALRRLRLSEDVFAIEHHVVDRFLDVRTVSFRWTENRSLALALALASLPSSRLFTPSASAQPVVSWSDRQSSNETNFSDRASKKNMTLGLEKAFFDLSFFEKS